MVVRTPFVRLILAALLTPLLSLRSAAPGGSQVTDAFVRASAKALISSGLAEKGYKYVNVDEGWLLGRHAGNNTICERSPSSPLLSFRCVVLGGWWAGCSLVLGQQ